MKDHSGERLERDLLEVGTRVVREFGPFDVILAAPHPLSFGEMAAELARRASVPLVLNFHDPIGSRDLSGFSPSEPARQAALIEGATGVAFASPLTAERYRLVFPFDGKPVAFLPDSFRESPGCGIAVETRSDAGSERPVRLLHAGNLSDYRPVDALARALTRWTEEYPEKRIELVCMGMVAAKNADALERVRGLRLRVLPELPYERAQEWTSGADVLVAIVGPRHIDNLPSKLFEYLGKGRPVLLLGPIGNPAKEIVERLGVGTFSMIEDEQDIYGGLCKVIKGRREFEAAYTANRERIDAYECRQTARRWADFLSVCLAARAQS